MILAAVLSDEPVYPRVIILAVELDAAQAPEHGLLLVLLFSIVDEATLRACQASILVGGGHFFLDLFAILFHYLQFGEFQPLMDHSKFVMEELRILFDQLLKNIQLDFLNR